MLQKSFLELAAAVLFVDGPRDRHGMLRRYWGVAGFVCAVNTRFLRLFASGMRFDSWERCDDN